MDHLDKWRERERVMETRASWMMMMMISMPNKYIDQKGKTYVVPGERKKGLEKKQILRKRK